MFQLTWDETNVLRSQFVILNSDDDRRANFSRSQIVILKQGGNVKYLPYAFTEQGVAMLSSVLHSKRAIEVNIAIMRAFVKLRYILSTNKELFSKLDQLENRIEKHDGEIHAIFEAIRQLMKSPPEKRKAKIGFHPSS